MCDIHSLAERAFNFPNMAFFETKSKIGTKMFRKHFENVSFMTVYAGVTLTQKPLSCDQPEISKIPDRKEENYQVIQLQ